MADDALIRGKSTGTASSRTLYWDFCVRACCFPWDSYILSGLDGCSKQRVNVDEAFLELVKLVRLYQRVSFVLPYLGTSAVLAWLIPASSPAYWISTQEQLQTRGPRREATQRHRDERPYRETYEKPPKDNNHDSGCCCIVAWSLTSLSQHFSIFVPHISPILFVAYTAKALGLILALGKNHGPFCMYRISWTFVLNKDHFIMTCVTACLCSSCALWQVEGVRVRYFFWPLRHHPISLISQQTVILSINDYCLQSMLLS